MQLFACSRKQTLVARRSSSIAMATTNRRRRSCDKRSMLLVVATASSLSKRKRCRRRQPSWLTTAIACMFRKLDPSLASSGVRLKQDAGLVRTGTDRYVAGSRSRAAACFENRTAVASLVCFETQKPPLKLPVSIFSSYFLYIYVPIVFL